MNYREYVRRHKIIESAVDTLKSRMEDLMSQEVDLPPNFRPIEAQDVIVGAPVWVRDDDGKDVFMIIERILDPSSRFKAFVVDGCRYGLEDTYVDADAVSGPETNMAANLCVGFGNCKIYCEEFLLWDESMTEGDPQTLSRKGLLFTLADIECIAEKCPWHEWKVVIEAPLYGVTYSRTYSGEWIITDKNKGFA